MTIELSSHRQARFATWIASGFGCGWAPVAPGTVGSVLGVAIGVALRVESPALLLAGTVLATYAGLWAIRGATGLPWRRVTKEALDDPGWIVIDEIAGQMLALLGLHRLSLVGVASAFLLFRLFDIGKPGPIGWADRQGGSAGIMADDLLAGAASACLLVLGQLAWARLHP